MIHLSNISKQYGNQVIFKNTGFQILHGAQSGLVGPNGAGKTTIFNLIMGEEEPDDGEISFAKKTTIDIFHRQ